jgi:hypothetical protein
VLWIVSSTVIGFGALLAGSLRRLRSLSEADGRSFASALSVTAHVVFVDRDDDVVTLDCVVASGTSLMPSGTPFTILAELPLLEESDVVTAEAILEQWASAGTAIDVDVVTGAHGAAVRMTSAIDRLQLGMAA